MTDDRSQMRDGDMPLLDRIESAMRRVTSGQGQMRVPVEATDPDVVLADCKREIERLRGALAKANAQAEHFERERYLRGDEIERLRAKQDGVPHDDLWQAQLAFWPNSVRLTPRNVIMWAFEKDDIERQSRRLRAVVMALQYPIHVWYRTQPTNGAMGCRFGLNGPEYLSGFDDL